VCDGIEKRIGSDAEAVAKAKLAWTPGKSRPKRREIGLDGYPIGMR
jgi:hypothetical protein